MPAFAGAILLLAGAALSAGSTAQAQSTLSPAFAAGGASLSPSARAGREIWFFATAFNDRFYTYSYPQRLGAAIDWYLILAAKNKGDLFQGWGAIPDPDCCIPGDAKCPAKTPEETYGFQWCPGDTELLRFVGREGYRDPACDFADAPFNPDTPHGRLDQRQSACDLRFGTSTGALGLRKFPNPRFDAAKWEALNKGRASWDRYRELLNHRSASADAPVNRLFDGSIEPPFRIGMACGACHIAYHPVRPPADPSRPAWDNIDGLVGNQYSRASQMLASGMPRHSIEWQLIAGTARPGTVDTSALPMDTVGNPGTMNPLINFARRPKQAHRVLKWRKASQCPEGPATTCWCEPEKTNKCWERSERSEQVPNILKGGEDSIGLPEALQRVYFNIGSCAEQCWLNHVPDLRAVDPGQRNYGQTPLDIGQCRRDCASFRAIEDRLDDVVAFLLTARPADLWRARGLNNPGELDAQLEREFGRGAPALGRQVFARTCARCHSSRSRPYDSVDFRATDPLDPTLRLDWLSSGRPVLASRVGTHRGRALHSNHMPSRVWDEYAARDLHERPVDPALPEIMKGSGRGYYRPPSLLSVWAYAPFMHNNAIGPELCGRPANKEIDFYASPYVDGRGAALVDPPACWPFDPSVEGRWRLFKASMEELLNPRRRTPKVALTTEDVVVGVVPAMQIGGLELGLSVALPKGKPVVLLNSLRYKDLLQDLVLSRRPPGDLEAKYRTVLPPERLDGLHKGLDELYATLRSAPLPFTFDVTKVQSDFVQAYYSNVLEPTENTGHEFGKDLSEREKQALIAFLATL
jgi:hypothetical protein